MSEHGLVAARRKLLRPVDDGRFEEATTTKLEEGNQVPHHAQTTETNRRKQTQYDFLVLDVVGQLQAQPQPLNLLYFKCFPILAFLARFCVERVSRWINGNKFRTLLIQPGPAVFVRAFHLF